MYVFTNQASYNKLCTSIIAYIQQYLVLHLNMKEDWVPLAADNMGKKGANNIFYSSTLAGRVDDLLRNTRGCVVLIQGTGHVRAG